MGDRYGKHRSPAPWSVRELERAFVVEDANGQAVTYTYFRHDPNEARQANVLTHRGAGKMGKPGSFDLRQSWALTTCINQSISKCTVRRHI